MKEKLKYTNIQLVLKSAIDIHKLKEKKLLKLVTSRNSVRNKVKSPRIYQGGLIFSPISCCLTHIPPEIFS